MTAFRFLLLTPTILLAFQDPVHAQGLLFKAQGTKNSATSLGFQVNLDSNVGDANIINAAEISANVVNECGRTLLAGKIDIGTVTEAALANNSVTSVTKGSTVDVLLRSVNQDGLGPYSCDLDLSSNADGVSGQTKLVVKETDAKNGDVSLQVTLPGDLACIGASTGNICTIRCLNTAMSGPFGGCFAVKQSDITPNINTADNIATAQTLEGVLAQVAQN